MSILAILTAMAITPAPAADSAADVVTFRDGAIVRGQVFNPDDRGMLIFIVRRDWADRELPDRARDWRAAEIPWMKRARAERLDRLKAWERQRRATMTPEQTRGDTILNWLVAEIDHLGQLGPDDELPSLMMIALKRREIQSVERRPPKLARLLRLGWRSGFPDVETMKPADLKAALEGRNFAVAGNDPAPIADLLPMPIETDARWLSRRAATEVAHDDGQRLIRFQGMVLPESQPGMAANPDQLLNGLVGSLLGDKPAEDPLAAQLRALGARGRVGAVLTSLEYTPDLAGAQVNVMLLVRLGPENWRPAASRSATVHASDLGPNAGANLPNDPQVKPLFDLVAGLGLPDYAARMQTVGAATQQALGRARAMIEPDLKALELPIGAGTK